MERVYGLIELLTGARKGEAARVINSFFALFLLLTSYYLIKPLRNSYLNREFDPSTLPYLFLAIPIISLLITRIFNWFYDRVPRLMLILMTYAVIIACKIAFWLFLPQGGKVITLVFYYWTTVYFLLAISILWGVMSSIFNSEVGERVFAFISFGAVAGALVGSKASEWLAHSPFKDLALPLSGIVMGAVIGFLALAMRASGHAAAPVRRSGDSPQSHTFLSDFVSLWRKRYVRAIAVMVFALAFMNTVLEFRSQKVIDEQQAQSAYLKHFASLNSWLCQQQSCPLKLHQQSFEKILHLRNTDKAQRQAELEVWFKTSPFKGAELYQAYVKYQDELEGLTRGNLASINFWTNLLGVILLLVVAKPMFHYLGIRQVLIQLPVCFIVVGVMLWFPMDVSLMSLIVIITGTLNYSLNKTAKELLYTQADDEARFRFKPLIDGPVMRLGDVSAAGLSILLLDIVHLPESVKDALLISAGLGFSIWWFFSSWEAGKEYERLKQEQTPHTHALESVS